jgi:hypothetical protein
MSDYSTNASNKSPNQTPPHSLPLLIPFNPVQTTIAPQYPPLSPQTALNALTTQMDLNKTVHAIAYELISTMHNQEVLHALESKQLAKSNDELATTNQDLQKWLERYSQQADRKLELPIQPHGYEDNAG